MLGGVYIKEKRERQAKVSPHSNLELMGPNNSIFKPAYPSHYQSRLELGALHANGPT